MNQRPLTGVILAGGKGLRVGGVDKGLMELDGAPLVQYAVELIKPYVDSTVIIANRSLSAYEQLAHFVYTDKDADYEGPLVAMATALQHSTTEWSLFLPCDTPYLSSAIIEALIAASHTHLDANVVVAHDEVRLQPLVCLVRKRVLPSLECFLSEGGRKVASWQFSQNCEVVKIVGQQSSFRNLNTPDDFS